MSLLEKRIESALTELHAAQKAKDVVYTDWKAASASEKADFKVYLDKAENHHRESSPTPRHVLKLSS